MLEITTTTKNYVSKRLEKATASIIRCADGINSKSFEICYKVAEVAKAAKDDNTILSQDGFKNVAEWCENAFGFQKSSTNYMERIGRQFIIKNGTRYTTNFVASDERKDNFDGDYIEFTYSQLLKMLPFDEIMVRDCVAKGIIQNTMSCREIERVLKEVKESLTEHDTEVVEEPTEEPTEESANAEVQDDTVYVDVWDGAGVCFRIPHEILMNYIVDEQ